MGYEKLNEVGKASERVQKTFRIGNLNPGGEVKIIVDGDVKLHGHLALNRKAQGVRVVVTGLLQKKRDNLP